VHREAAHLHDEQHASRRAAAVLISAGLVPRAARGLPLTAGPPRAPAYTAGPALVGKRPIVPARLDREQPATLGTVDATPATEIAPAARPAGRQAASSAPAARPRRTSGAALRVRYDASGRIFAQAYAYAGGRPHLNIDPEGRYIFDGSWSADAAASAVAEKAFVELINSAQCKCVFKTIFGGAGTYPRPFQDPFWIRYVASLPPSRHGEAVLGLAPPGADHILIAKGATADVTSARETLAHEIAHQSYDIDEIQDFAPSVARSPFAIGRACRSDSIFNLLLLPSSTQNEIRQCCECGP
jgi:hypothetical protein